MYSVIVPAMMKTLESLSGMLDKAAVYADSKQPEWMPAGSMQHAIVTDHLIFDQFPLVRQVQAACDNAKLGIARIAGVEAPAHEDTEKTIPELKERIVKTLEFLRTITPEQLNGREDEKATLRYMPGKYMRMFEYATLYMVPNFYFHATTAYSIMRKNGVPLGKGDYISNLPWQNI